MKKKNRNETDAETKDNMNNNKDNNKHDIV